MSDGSPLAEEVGYLRDLFQRKLLEDRQKNDLIVALQRSLAERDALASGDAFRALFEEALLALDRLRSERPDPDLLASVADELLEVFTRRGLQQVPTEGRLDARYHEVVSTVPASGSLPSGHIVAVEREGYHLADRLVRPARVIVAVEVASTVP